MSIRKALLMFDAFLLVLSLVMAFTIPTISGALIWWAVAFFACKWLREDLGRNED